MANRTTPQAVCSIIDVQEDYDVMPMLTTANVLVTDILDGQGLSSALLQEIEKYLAAHFVALSVERGSLIRSAVGDSAETYQDIYSEGLNSTRFGQMAAAIDTSGKLQATMNSKLKAEFRIV